MMFLIGTKFLIFVFILNDNRLKGLTYLLIMFFRFTHQKWFSFIFLASYKFIKENSQLLFIGVIVAVILHIKSIYLYSKTLLKHRPFLLHINTQIKCIKDNKKYFPGSTFIYIKCFCTIHPLSFINPCIIMSFCVRLCDVRINVSARPRIEYYSRCLFFDSKSLIQNLKVAM